MLGRTTLAASSPRISLGTVRNTLIALALAAMALGSSAGAAMAWDGGAFSGSDESLLFSLTNQDRASAGLNALVNDSYLHKEAEWRAKDMGDRNYFAHAIPPGGLKVFDYEQQDGYCFTYAGENIGLSTFDDAVATTRIEAAFMKSASHRANILGTWARLGVGAYKAADGRKLYAVLFSIPCGAAVPKPKPVAKPTPVAKPKPVPTTTPRVTTQPLPSASASAPTPTPEASSTATPIPSAVASQPSSSAPGSNGAAPSGEPSNTPTTTENGAGQDLGQPSTMRVREQTVSQGPLESLFNALFGGVFGS
jgi:uncharacterized protein YkwD